MPCVAEYAFYLSVMIFIFSATQRHLPVLYIYKARLFFVLSFLNMAVRNFVHIRKRAWTVIWTVRQECICSLDTGSTPVSRFMVMKTPRRPRAYALWMKYAPLHQRTSTVCTPDRFKWLQDQHRSGSRYGVGNYRIDHFCNVLFINFASRYESCIRHGDYLPCPIVGQQTLLST